MFDLTRKEQKWRWDSSEASALRKLKELVTSAPVLITPADDQPFRIEADSSDFATGVVLSQLSAEDGKWHPVAFLSKSLSETERNYEIHDKEMLAIMRALDEWRHFLEGAPHKVEMAKEDIRPSPPKSTLIDPPACDDYPIMDDYNPIPIDVELITSRVRKVQNRFVGAIFQDLRD